MTTTNNFPDFMVSDSDYDPYEDASNVDRLAAASGALNQLSPSRANDDDQSRRVGMALFTLGYDGYILFDTWYKQSINYQPGKCARWWKSYTKESIAKEGITFFTLLDWVQQDGSAPHIRPCPRNAKPSDYELAITALGYRVAQNEMNDEIFINGIRLSDPFEAHIVNSLFEHGYKSEQMIRRCILDMGFRNQFHPIRDYLNSLKWDGTDYIKKLGSFFLDKDDIFTVLLRKWLIGAVGRILSPEKAIQNPVLVLDGPQGLGKSQFTYWIGSPLPAFYLQSAITAGDKDSLIRLCSVFVWELGELGATFRRSDIESLKAFISQLTVTVRAPYGRRDMHKPPTASFIGTINNIAGFLSDPTGNRRYRSCTLTNINWDYDKEVNPNNIWAQAVALFLGGETNELDSKTQKIVNDINQKYEVDDPIAFAIYKTFDIDPKNKNKNMATAEIIKQLRAQGDIISGDDRQIGQRIANVLYKAGCEYGKFYVNNKQVRGWKGIELAPVLNTI